MYERPVEVNAPWPGQRLGAFLRRQVETGRPDLPLLSVSAQRGVTRRVSDWGDGLRAASSDLSGYLVARPGDIVVNKLAAIDGALGRSSYLGLVSPAYYVLRAIPGVDTRFVDYLLHAAPYLSEIGRRSKWMPPAQFDISWELLRSMTIHLPNYETQVRIADYLDRETQRIDELLDHNGTLLGRLRERWERIVFQGVTTGSMDGSAGTTELSGDWFGAVPSHWRAAQYRRLAEIGTGHTPSRSEPAYWQECDIPWLTTADVRRFREDEVERIRETTHKISELGLRHSAAVKHPAGSVAMSRTASVGFSVILDQEAAVSQGFVVWRPSAQMLPEYLLWSLRAMRYVGHLDRLMMGSTHKTIYWDALSAIGGPVPPVEEQRQVVADIREAVSDIATLRSSLLRQADLLRERRRALITAAVTGEVEVGEAV